MFGCKAYDFIPRGLRTKEFEQKCKIGYFVGYFPNGAWKVYVPALNKEMPPAGSVTFDEHIESKITYYYQNQGSTNVQPNLSLVQINGHTMIL